MIRIGHGYDIHRLVEGRALRLAGVGVPFEKGLLGHSDGDVVLHALCDALLGAAALGDIGSHFPNDDARYEGIDSAELLTQVVRLLQGRELTIGNVDITIVAERPKLAPYVGEMRRRLSELLGLDEGWVSVKAKTNEGLDSIGRGEAIAANAVVLVESAD